MKKLLMLFTVMLFISNVTQANLLFKAKFPDGINLVCEWQTHQQDGVFTQGQCTSGEIFDEITILTQDQQQFWVYFMYPSNATYAFYGERDLNAQTFTLQGQRLIIYDPKQEMLGEEAQTEMVLENWELVCQPEGFQCFANTYENF
jgi:hypothetical protein